MDGCPRARWNLRLLRRRRTTGRQNQDQSRKSGAAAPRIALHGTNTPAGRRSFPALCAALATIPKIGDNQRLQIVDKTEKEILSAIGLMEKKRWDQATAKLEVLMADADPEVADKANNLMAAVYAATQRNAESEALLRRSIEYRGADNGNLGNQLACLCVVVGRQGRIKEADETMVRALDAARSDLPALTVFILRNAAYMQWASGNPDRAREIYSQMPTYKKNDLEFVIEMNKYYLEPAVPKEIGR